MSDSEIRVWCFNGELKKRIINKQLFKFSEIYVLSDRFVLTEDKIENVVQMWNCVTGELLNTFFDSNCVGVMPFGFFLSSRRENDLCLLTTAK